MIIIDNRISQDDPKEVSVPNENVIEHDESSISKVIIKYFLHPNLTDKRQFDVIKNQLLKKLKFSTESILLSSVMLKQSDPLKSSRKEIINEELNRQLTSLPVFERSLLLCLLSQFEEFKIFDYPPEFETVKRGFTWIEANFDQYIHTLNQHRDPEQQPLDLSDSELVVVTDSLLSNDLKFCTNPPNDSPSISKIPDIIFNMDDYSFLSDMYFVDEEVAESLINAIFIDDLFGPNFDPKTTSLSPRKIDLLKELCNSAYFEIKLMDFCLFNLYCWDESKLGFENFLNADDKYGSLCLTILSFLKIYLPQKPYLLYQPRLYLEQYGLKSLQDVKHERKFLNKTASMASVCDLLIGLFDVKKITKNTQFYEDYKSLIFNITSNTDDFEVIIIQEGEELADKVNVFSLSSCEKLVTIYSFEKLLKDHSSIILYHPGYFTDYMREKITLVYSCLKHITQDLKTVIQDRPSTVCLADIKPLCELQLVLDSLEEVLFAFTNTISKWFLNESKEAFTLSMNSSIQTKCSEKFIKALGTFSKEILHEERTQKFVLYLYEIATYALHENLVGLQQTYSLIFCITNICLHHYTLLCVHEELSDYQKDLNQRFKGKGEEQLPLLSHIASKEYHKDVLTTPDLLYVFADLHASQEKNFDILFADLCRKNIDIVVDVASNETKSKQLQKELHIVCRRQPWVLDLETKARILE